jgi:hypothetical protein
MSANDVAGMVDAGNQGQDDPTQLGGDSQQQSQDPGSGQGSPPIADPSTGQDDQDPWASIDPTEPGPPRRDHERALHNARQQAVEELLGGRTREDVTTALAMSELDDNQLLAFVLARNPELQERFLTQSQPQQPQTREGHDEHGIRLPERKLDQYTGQYFYPAEEMDRYNREREAAIVRQFESTVDQRLQPFQERDEQTQQARAAEAQLTVYENSLPGFKDLMDSGEIQKILSRDRRTTLLSAYQTAFKSVYEPKRRAAERKQLLDELNGKGKTQNEGRPQGGAGSKALTSKDLQSMRGNKGWDAAMAEAEAEAGQA